MRSPSMVTPRSFAAFGSRNALMRPVSFLESRAAILRPLSTASLLIPVVGGVLR